MIYDLLLLSLFVVLCVVFWRRATAIVMIDKIMVIVVIHFMLAPLPNFDQLDLPFKFLFGAKDLMVFSLLFAFTSGYILKSSYLMLSLVSFGILTANFVLSDPAYDYIYALYPYCVIIISAGQMVGIISDGGHDDDDGGKLVYRSIFGRYDLSSSNLQAQKG